MRILVVAAHPDDDILGCGGTMARLTGNGAAVKVLFMADGVTSRGDDPDALERRQGAAQRALARVGVTQHDSLQLPDNQLDTIPMLTLGALVRERVVDFAPDTVITHSLSDLNVDHRQTAEAVLVACRPQPGETVQRILNFEVPSATGWMPGGRPFDPRYYVDVTDCTGAKREALEEYAEEMRPWPHARSLAAVDALLSWRGASVGVAAAEAFEVSRWVDVT